MAAKRKVKKPSRWPKQLKAAPQPDGAIIWRYPADMPDNLDRNRMVWVENCRLPWLAGESGEDCRADVYLLEEKRRGLGGSPALADLGECLITGSMTVIGPWYPAEPGGTTGFWHSVFRHNMCDEQPAKWSMIPKRLRREQH